jgi:predicted phage terminase large subunit-like protein
MIHPQILARVPQGQSPILMIAKGLGQDRLDKFISSLTGVEAMLLRYEWDLYARPAQRPPEGKWDTWVIMAGRGFGKTRPGAEQCKIWAEELGKDYGGGHIGLIAKDPQDARDVMIEGESGILACSPPWFRPTYEPSKRLLTWPNGVIAHTYSAETPDDLRGPQHHKLWGDEPCKWKHGQDTWDMAELGLRLGHNPQALLTTTPRPVPFLIALLKEPGTRVTTGSTYENQANLSKKFIKKIIRKYEGTRLGRQELHAEMLTDTPGALWTLDLIESLRVQKMPCELVTAIIAIDPAGVAPKDEEAEDDEMAETGMVYGGKGEDGHLYVCGDISDQLSPAKWGRKAVSFYETLKMDRIIAETNNGGDMVEHVVRTAAEHLDIEISFRKITASRGKHTRAEPVAALYEQRRAHHVGLMPDLEDQMTTWVPGDKSPDRMDALVWLGTEAMLLSPDDEYFA